MGSQHPTAPKNLVVELVLRSTGAAAAFRLHQGISIPERQNPDLSVPSQSTCAASSGLSPTTFTTNVAQTETRTPSTAFEAAGKVKFPLKGEDRDGTRHSDNSFSGPGEGTVDEWETNLAGYLGRNEQYPQGLSNSANDGKNCPELKGGESEGSKKA